MSEVPTPLIVAIAIHHAEIRCPCCQSTNASDFTLIEPELRCYAVTGTTLQGALALSEDAEPAEFWSDTGIPPRWLFCRCGQDFPLPAGVQFDYGGRPAPRYRTDDYRFPASAASLPIPHGRRGTPPTPPEAA